MQDGRFLSLVWCRADCYCIHCHAVSNHYYFLSSLQFEFGFSALLLSPVTCSVLAFLRSLQAERMTFTRKVCKVQSCLLLFFFSNSGVGTRSTPYCSEKHSFVTQYSSEVISNDFLTFLHCRFTTYGFT